MKYEVTRLQKEEEEGNSSIFSLFCKGKLNHPIKVLPQFTSFLSNSVHIQFKISDSKKKKKRREISELNQLIGLYDTLLEFSY